MTGDRRLGLLAAGLVTVVALAAIGIWLRLRDTTDAPEYEFLAAVEHCTGFDGSGRTHTLAFSPDGAWLASAGTDGVSLWDTGAQELANELPFTGAQADDPVYATVAFSPDGELLAAATPEGVWLWRTASWEHVRTLSLASAGVFATSVGSIAFSPGGELIAVGGSALPGEFVGLDSQDFAEAVDEHTKGRVWIWDQATGEMTVELDFGETDFPGVATVAFTPDGDSLVSVGGAAVRLSDPHTEQEQTVFGVSVHGRSQSIAPGGDLIAIATGSDVQLWDVESSQRVEVIEPGPGAAELVTFSPDGSFLATVSSSFHIRDPARSGAPGALWSPEGRELRELDPPERSSGICAGTNPPVDGLAISADGLLVVQNRGGLYWWRSTSE